jgi:hypothetical protein
MDPGLNLLGQTTCLSDGARAQKPPCLVGVMARFEERRGGVDDLAR